MSESAVERSPAGAHLRAESLLSGHRYVTLPPFGPRRFRRLLVCAPTRVERWRLARSAAPWGGWRRGARLAAVRAAATLSTGWCLLSPGREPPAQAMWHSPTLDHRLRHFVEKAASAAVLTPLDDRGHVLGVVTGSQGRVFIKAVDTASSASSLANEARMLRAVAPACAPMLLDECIEADAGFIVTEVVHPVRRQPSLAPDTRAIELLESLPRDREEDGESHPWIVSLLASGCPTDVERWSKVLHRRRWPLVVLHGDLLPSNIAMRVGGELVLVDWEFGSLAGFPGVDAAQWVIHVGTWSVQASTNVISSVFTSWACGRQFGGTRITRDEARAILALTAYSDYRRHTTALGGGSSDYIQRVRSSLWTYDTP